MDSIIGWHSPYDSVSGGFDDSIDGHDDEVDGIISAYDDVDDNSFVGAMIGAGFSNAEIGRRMRRRQRRQARRGIVQSRVPQQSVVRAQGAMSALNRQMSAPQEREAMVNPLQFAKQMQSLSTGTAQAQSFGQSLLGSDQARVIMPLGVTTAIAIGGAWTLSNSIQRPFQPYVLVLEARYAVTAGTFIAGNDASGVVSVSQINVGTDNQLAAVGSMGAAQFNPGAFNNMVTFKAAGPGVAISVSGVVDTIAGSTVQIKGSMYGVAAHN